MSSLVTSVESSHEEYTSSSYAPELRFLRLSDLPNWDLLVDLSPEGSVFYRSWWIQAVAGEVRILGYFDHGRLVAGMPFYFRKRFGMTIASMPLFTQTWGVVIEPLQGKVTHVLSRQTEILNVFAGWIARSGIVFRQRFHPNLQNWLPFYWQGFFQTSRVTYVFRDLRALDSIWAGLRENIRREIRKAKKRSITVRSCEIGEIEHLIIAARRRSVGAYRARILRTIVAAAHDHDAGDCFASVDQEGRVHAAAVLVWDHHRAYYLTGGGDPQLRSSGATSLLMWHLIETAAQRSSQFDFEGSCVEPIERFFRAFGGRQVFYNEISRMPAWLRAGMTLVRDRA